MYITTLSYSIACKYWRLAKNLDVYCEVIAYNEHTQFKEEYAKVYTVKVSGEQAFEATMRHTVGIGEEPLEAMKTQFKATHILYTLHQVNIRKK